MDTPFRTLVVDDEPVARQVLKEELAAFPSIQIAGEAQDGRDAIGKIRDLRPDVVFLDVQMPELTGFEVLARLDGPLPPVIIFVTAYDQFALRAFEVGAVDYLLKPVGFERLQQAVARIPARAQAPKTTGENIARAVDAYQTKDAPPKLRRIAARRGREFYLLDLEDILYFQAEGEIVWLNAGGRRYMATSTLQALEERLADTQFRRIHRNALVNVGHVKKMSALSSQRWLLTLTNGEELIVSKRLAHSVRDILHN